MQVRIPQTKLFFLLLLFSTSLFSQNQSGFVSFEDLEKHKEQDTAKVNLYIQVGKEYMDNQNLDSAFHIINSGLFLAKKLDYTYAIGEFYAMQGDIRVIQNDLFQALDYYLISIKYMMEGNQKGKLANVLLVIGNIYVAQANYPKALEYYQKGEVIADSLNMISMMVHFYNNKGELYRNLGQFEESIKNYDHALEIYKDSNDDYGQASIHTNLSDVFLKMGNIQQARIHVEEAVIIYEKSSNHEGLLNTYNSMAAIERKKGKFKLAVTYYEKGLEHLKLIGIEYKGPKAIYEANLYTNIGFCSLKIKDYDYAEENLLKGHNLALNSGLLGTLSKTALYLSDLYKLEGDIVQAFNFYQEYDEYSDSLSDKENIKKITQLQMQYEFDKQVKQREAEHAKHDAIQKRKELVYIGVISGVLLAITILFLLFRLQINKNKRINLQRKNLLSDLDFKNKELTTNVMYLLKKNEFIINISDKLKKSRYEFKPENRKTVDDIIRELDHGAKGDVWKDFEVRFQEVHSGFYKRLNKQFPDLSPNELKLCAFLRLNMSTKEISTITFQSTKSINMARFRLRKKIEIGNYDNLVTFLGQL